uniref:NADH dehydrogenase subunit 4L n=1 Tax=Pheidole flavens TaxID=458933 RepID=A0A2U8XCR7_9HYME|nr:NADH dehydrogenase subunit 4L [Pheidole flavens]
MIFLVSLMLLIFLYKYMLIMLLLLELLVLMLSLIMFLVLGMSMLDFYMIYYLVFSVCESVLGLSLMVMIVRYYGSEMYYMFNISKF